MKIHVVPWYRGNWKVVTNKIEYVFWRISWILYYPTKKNQYEWE